jgi:hypothetical protein
MSRLPSPTPEATSGWRADFDELLPRDPFQKKLFAGDLMFLTISCLKPPYLDLGITAAIGGWKWAGRSGFSIHGMA